MSEQNLTPAANANAEPVKVDNPAAPATSEPVKANDSPAPVAAAADPAVPPQADKSEGKGQVVTETYDLKVPEGAPIDASYAEKITDFAKKTGLNQAQAQALLDRDAAMAKDQINARENILAEWKTKASNDPEIGGEKFTAKVESAHRALEAFGSDATKEFLDASGLGNHPEAIRLLSKIGEAMADDKAFIPTVGGKAQPKSAAETLFGYMNDPK